jgi:phosphate transport system permease protein
MPRLAWRNLVNNVMLSLTAVCTFLTVSMLFLILGYLIYNGGKSLDWNFFTQLPKGPGEAGGGMANAIVGTAKLVGLASVIGIPIGFIAGIYLSEFGGITFPFIIRYIADLLNGVPSIVVGIVAYALVVLPLKHFSAWAGSVALAIMLIPVVVRNTEQFLQGVPQSLREGALSLGASKWRTIVTVVVPASISGILTGIILGVARIAGETAPLIFTSFGNQFWSSGFNEPTSSLPVMIYNYAISPYDDWHRQAWAAGLVLLALVLVSNILARGVLARGVAANRG